MLKRYLVSFVCGAVATLGYALHLGPDALINVGVRWQAAQRDYVVYSEPARELDETGVAEILASAPVKKPAARKPSKR